MAEETLVKEALTEDMIVAGADLTRSLDRAHWPVAASLWSFVPETNQWRLILASSAVAEEGPLAAYRHVSQALRSSASKLSLDSVSVVAPTDSLVKVLTSAYRTDSGLEGRRVFRTAINGHFVDDAYVYRLPSVAPAA